MEIVNLFCVCGAMMLYWSLLFRYVITARPLHCLICVARWPDKFKFQRETNAGGSIPNACSTRVVLNVFDPSELLLILLIIEKIISYGILKLNICLFLYFLLH